MVSPSFNWKGDFAVDINDDLSFRAGELQSQFMPWRTPEKNYPISKSCNRDKFQKMKMDIKLIVFIIHITTWDLHDRHVTAACESFAKYE